MTKTQDAPETIVSLICETAMVHTGRFFASAPKGSIDYDKLSRCLKEVAKEKIGPALALLQEANEAFFGHNGMLTMTLNTVAIEIAAEARKRYQA